MAKIRDADLSEFQVLNLAGKYVRLSTLTDPAELRTLLAMATMVAIRMEMAIAAAHDISSISDEVAAWDLDEPDWA